MKYLFALVLIFTTHLVQAQTLPAVDMIRLEKASDFKNAEPYVLQTVRFLFMTPVQKESKDREAAFKFIMQWMSGTPSYSFTLGEVESKISSSNTDIVGMYIAGMIQYALENKDKPFDPRQMKLSAVRSLVSYTSDPSKKLKPSKQIKKLHEADTKGELEKEFFN